MTPNKLTVEDVERLLERGRTHNADMVEPLARQLLDAMRENERIASTLREIYFVQRLPESAFAECVNIAARGLDEKPYKHSLDFPRMEDTERGRKTKANLDAIVEQAKTSSQLEQDARNEQANRMLDVILTER